MTAFVVREERLLADDAVATSDALKKYVGSLPGEMEKRVRAHN